MSHAAVIPVLAHLGHWYIDVPIYLGPVLVLGIWFAVAGWRERRDERRGDGKSEPSGSESRTGETR